MTARVLVVDDTDANVRLLTAQLEADYFEVSTARSGLEALRKAQEEQPDVILLDVMMPGLNGFETCRRLKAMSETQHIPIILITALDGREDRLSDLKLGPMIS